MSPKHFGIFGWPVEHSLSPKLHNEAFQKAGLDWHYKLLPTRPEELEAAVRRFREEGFAGANVTVPHKEKIIAFLDGTSDTARAIGAVNTLYWKGDKLWGDNTDADGFLEDLKQKGVEVKDKPVLILGSGGSAKAIKYALEQAGAGSIHTWTRRSGDKLVAEEITVNCTPGLDQAMLDSFEFKAGQVLYDLVYVPEQTPLMLKAQKDGAKAYNGYGMLVEQARLSRQVWLHLDHRRA